jgi:hypothetical protein
MASNFGKEKLDRTLTQLGAILDLNQTESVGLVICGGSALIALELRARTTNDVDILAGMERDGSLKNPEPLPAFLLRAAKQVARDFGLNEGWLNNQPSKEEGGLFQMGLPIGLAERLVKQEYGTRLSVYFISRLDQIHLKLYALADQEDPTHLADLRALNPSDEELEMAARWAMTHDVSEPFRGELKRLLKGLGHESVAQNI